MQPGNSLAHYSVIAKIGAGGMGEVFKAQDTKLRRDVALKVLPAEFGADPERLARFEREARTLAALQHPNIATIFGLEHADDRIFLVMELVEGENLAQRLERGPLPLAEALAVGARIAAGLEAAHERGIVHRDLKPANVMQMADGQVKILDFGLARAYLGESPGDQDVSNSPTLTAAMTGLGVILGTAAYMSPEQARGHDVDRRTDIWAFGCLLFELLSGARAFPGDTLSDTVASVLKSDPPWAALPADLPRPLLRLLHRCLEKEPRRRLHDVADARIEIEDLLAGRQAVPEALAAAPAARPGGRRRWLLPVLATIALAAGLAAGRGSVRPQPPTPEPVRRLLLEADDFVPRTNTAIAADGSAFVYPGRAENAVWLLMLRRLDQFGVKPIPGTEYGINPFLSPDGKWVVFARDGVVRKIPAGGGPAQTLCETRGEMNGVWGSDGYLYITGTWDIADNLPAICRLPEGGGAPELLLRATNSGENFYDPFLLPDGKTLLFTGADRGERIEALDLASGRRQVIVEGGSFPVFTQAGQLVYYESRADRLLNAPFDPRTLTLGVSPGVLLDEVTVFAVAASGMAVYAPFAIRSDDIVVRVARDGTWTPLLDEPSSWAQPRIAPDGGSLLLRKTASPNCYLWRYDLERRVLTRVTFDRDAHDAAWSPDGATIAFCATGDRARAIFAMPADGSTPPQALTTARNGQTAAAWSPDAGRLIYTESAASTGPDLWVVAAEDTTAVPEVFLQTDYAEDHARFSPDGDWVAYTSDESGREEVYLRPFRGHGGKIQVSREGGTGALWAPDGRELFFASGDRMMVVDVAPGSPLQVGSPRELFRGDFAFERVGNYDIAPDGQSFYVVRSARQDEGGRGFYVVTNALDGQTP